MKQFKEKMLEAINNNKCEIAILFFTFLYLAPIIKCDFISDDGIYYYLRGSIILNDNSIDIFKIAYEKMIGWINRGRFFPLSIYSIFIMYFLNNNLLYKTIIILTICINVGMFGVFVEQLTESKRVKLILMLFINLFFQVITIYHSPFLSFHMFMQVMFAILMAILINLQLYFNKHKVKNIIISILFFIIGLLIYELAFAYIGIIIVLIFYYNKSILKSIKLCTIYMVPIIIMSIINIIIKMSNVIGYEGINVAHSPLKFINTIIKQCYAAIPLSNYLISRNNGILNSDISSIILNISVQDILITIMFFVILYGILKYTEDIKIKVHKGYLLLFCLAFYVFPGVLSSLTEKYQKELGFGIAHISVYMQYFGLIMIFLWLYMYLKTKFENKEISKFFINCIRNVSLIIISIIILLNQQNTRLYINNANIYWKYPKEAIQNALRLNILNELTEYDTLSVLTPYAWESDEFYSEFSNKKIHYAPIENVIHDNVDKLANSDIITIYPKNAYVIRYYGNERENEAFLGKMESVCLDRESEEIINILVSNVKVFTNNINNNHVVSHSIDESGYTKDNIIKKEDLAIVNTYGEKIVYQINTNELIDFNTISFLHNYTEPIESIVVNYGAGISGLETSVEEKWRWCEKDAEIKILNTTKKDIKAKISITVANNIQDLSQLYLNFNDKTKILKYNYLGNSMTLIVTLKPGSNALKLSTDAPQVYAPNDIRNMFYRIKSFNVVKID